MVRDFETDVRGALATVQIAFSMVLLVLAALFAQSLVNVARIDLGIDVDSLLSFSVAPQLNGYDAERAARLQDEIHAALAAQPAVTGLTLASSRSPAQPRCSRPWCSRPSTGRRGVRRALRRSKHSATNSAT